MQEELKEGYCDLCEFRSRGACVNASKVPRSSLTDASQQVMNPSGERKRNKIDVVISNLLIGMSHRTMSQTIFFCVTDAFLTHSS